MILQDIQRSLDELQERHPGITEEMVGVMLTAGGWEKKSIEEAQLLFRSRSVKSAFPHEDDIFLPPLEEKLIEAPEVVAAAPPESLVRASGVTEVKQSSLPDNLPLRPFETSPHVWSFSKYKDVFHADTSTPLAPLQAKSVASRVIVPEEQKQEISYRAPEKQPELLPHEVQAYDAPEIIVAKTSLTKKDEVMIAFGAALLLAAVLLILYMFNNGRL